MRKFGLIFIVLVINISLLFSSADRLDTLLDNFEKEYLKLHPEKATDLELSRDLEYVDYGSYYTYSKKELEKEYKIYNKYYKELIEIDSNTLSAKEKKEYKLLKTMLELKIEGEKFKEHEYLLHYMLGFQSSIPTMLINKHRISNQEDVQNFIKRINLLPVVIANIREQIDYRKKNKLLAPRYSIERLISSMERFIEYEPKNHPLILSYKRKIKKGNLKKKKIKELEEKIIETLKNNVYPEYGKFINELKKLKREATDISGVWRLPEGDNYYKYCLKVNTTTDLTPEEIHEIGLNQIERIQNEIMKLTKELGIKGDNFSERINNYFKEIYGKNTDKIIKSNKKAVIRYKKIVRRMERKLSKYFKRTPASKATVKEIPEYAKGTLGTHYEYSKSVGTFYVSIWEGGMFEEGMKPLTYHETVPGHHLQISLFRESEYYRPYRSFFFYPGYVEGWAMYAEQLCKEIGRYRNNYQLISYYRSELLRAVRIVLDTGIHYKKWSREEAYNYMEKNLGWASFGSIDRYSVWPGQACGYEIGKLKILKIRDKYKEIKGETYNLKDFHEFVLEDGTIPLLILEDKLNNLQ
ncbi:MAG: DUF885 domain-containing protein [Candidatus Mcinerneyibacterium aminivorans]|uniref:DUF885 domain-containing protein n=1 Tax=Candidatus Mcinerneyibacterium aminivorans TaxID=2703815 RepID=A0A5D0MF61_9BACT|nr:MAG: DUF885 domain-containing protein [Candidatus Mcinerneyibacterium aminivorans]